MNFDVAVFTNLTSENLSDGNGVGPAETMEEHLDVMAGLFRRLKDKDIQRAVVNVDGAHSIISLGLVFCLSMCHHTET